MRPCSWRAPTKFTRMISPAVHLSISRSGISQVRWISSTPPSTMRWSSEEPGRWYLSSMLRWRTGRTSGSYDVAVNTGSECVVSQQHWIVCLALSTGNKQSRVSNVYRPVRFLSSLGQWLDILFHKYDIWHQSCLLSYFAFHYSIFEEKQILVDTGFYCRAKYYRRPCQPWGMNSVMSSWSSQNKRQLHASAFMPMFSTWR